jgi:hypothetical protein
LSSLKGHSLLFLKIGVTWASFSLSGKQLFSIDKVTIENVDNILNKINIKKAIGGDGILAKIVKNYKSYIAPQLTALVNLSIENNCFPAVMY